MSGSCWNFPPADVMVNVFCLLTAEDLSECTVVCKGWRNILKDRYTWRKTFSLDWKKYENTNWFAKYTNQYFPDGNAQLDPNFNFSGVPGSPSSPTSPTSPTSPISPTSSISPSSPSSPTSSISPSSPEYDEHLDREQIQMIRNDHRLERRQLRRLERRGERGLERRGERRTERRLERHSPRIFERMLQRRLYRTLLHSDI